MMQWMDSVLSKGDKMEFFHDEFRCPVYVKDVVTVILLLSNTWISGLTFLISIMILVYMHVDLQKTSLQTPNPHLFGWFYSEGIYDPRDV